MGIYSTKASWQRAIQSLVEYCVHRKIHPDVFTYSALALSSIAGLALFLSGRLPGLLWLVPGCVLVRLFLNLMDGQVARRLGLADRWGEVKNEFGDRLADATIFLGLGLGGYTDVRLGMLALALILCTSYLGILSKALGRSRLYAGVFGKGDRMVSLAAFTVYPLISGHLSSYNYYLAAAVLFAAITIIQRLVMIYRNIHLEGKM